MAPYHQCASQPESKLVGADRTEDVFKRQDIRAKTKLVDQAQSKLLVLAGQKTFAIDKPRQPEN